MGHAVNARRLNSMIDWTAKAEHHGVLINS